MWLADGAGGIFECHESFGLAVGLLASARVQLTFGGVLETHVVVQDAGEASLGPEFRHGDL